jgi:hypothetical protein
MSRLPRPAQFTIVLALLLSACGSPPDDVTTTAPSTDTLARYADGSPRTVAVRQRDSVLERRVYRPSGRLQRFEKGDSVRSFLDLHPVDSAAVFRDYLQGRWRNTSADPHQADANLYYVFRDDELTFETPSRDPIETLALRYRDGLTLETQNGSVFSATITGFDTVRVTGLTLVREAPPE